LTHIAGCDRGGTQRITKRGKGLLEKSCSSSKTRNEGTPRAINGNKDRKDKKKLTGWVGKGKLAECTYENKYRKKSEEVKKKIQTSVSKSPSKECLLKEGVLFRRGWDGKEFKENWGPTESGAGKNDLEAQDQKSDGIRIGQRGNGGEERT